MTEQKKSFQHLTMFSYLLRIAKVSKILKSQDGFLTYQQVHFFALFWSPFKKLSWDFNFLHIHEILALYNEKGWKLLEITLLVFKDTINLPSSKTVDRTGGDLLLCFAL